MSNCRVVNLDEKMGLITNNPWILLFLLLIPPAIVLFAKSKKRSKRGNQSSILRLISFVLLVTALTGIQLTRAAEKVNVVYLLDISDSIPEYMWKDALQYIEKKSSEMGALDTNGLIVFGSNASIEFTSLQNLPELKISSIVDKKGSDLSKAIYTAMGTFPDSGEKKIVIFSDGLETSGNALQAAKIASRSEISIITIPLGSTQIENECFIKYVDAPFSADLNQGHKVTVNIHSNINTPATLTFIKDGKYVGEQKLNLTAGENIAAFTSTLEKPGVHIYEITLDPLNDTTQENNYFSKIVHVKGSPSLLYVHQENQTSKSFLNVLKSQDYTLDTVDSFNIPSTFAELVKYDAIIFDNVPAKDISWMKMDLVRSYVKDAGGGFLMIGGDSSFGVGGYFKTPIEEILPVDMDVTSDIGIPSMSLLMLIDKSGSMHGSKLNLVKEAVLAAVDELNPFYEVACIAFDASYEWTLPPMLASKKDEIYAKISALGTGGGTILYPALEEAYEFLKTSKSAIKHMIVLSDGLLEEADFESISRSFAKEKISVSTVTIGEQTDQDLMKKIAKWGKGRSYHTADIRNIPQIFARETMIASKGIMENKTFTPIIENQDMILQGIGPDFPELGGFVLTYEKKGAKELLTTLSKNPVLSTMQYGLGKSAAFTSDLKGGWGKKWLYWDKFPQFVSQTIRWITRPKDSQNLHVTIQNNNGQGKLLIDSIDDYGNFVNDLDLKTNFSFSKQQHNKYDISQTAPGLYEFNFPIKGDGTYYFTIYNEKTEQQIHPKTYAYTVPYSAEYIPQVINETYLQEISNTAQGELISAETFKSFKVYEPSGKFQLAMRHIWPILTILALLCFVIDLTLRKRIFPKYFFRKLIFRKGDGNYSYEEIQNIISNKKKEEASKWQKKDFGYEGKNKNMDISARLYMAKKRNQKE